MACATNYGFVPTTDCVTVPILFVVSGAGSAEEDLTREDRPHSTSVARDRPHPPTRSAEEDVGALGAVGAYHHLRCQANGAPRWPPSEPKKNVSDC